MMPKQARTIPKQARIMPRQASMIPKMIENAPIFYEGDMSRRENKRPEKNSHNTPWIYC